MQFRRVLGVASAMVLVLVAALAVLQVRSWRTYETYEYDGVWEADPGWSRSVGASVSSENGYVTVRVRTRLWQGGSRSEPPGWRYTSERPSSNTRLVRANIDRGWAKFQGPMAVGFGEERWFFSIRYTLLWLRVLPLLAPCLLVVARRRRRPVASRCVECGYDLRASRERCPECATSIPEPPGFLFSRVHPAAMLACAAC